MPSDPHIAPPPLPADRLLDPIASYRVIGRLSRGGMGDILLAERRGFDGSTMQVVLKRLSAELEEEPYVSMFLSEAKVMARLDHPNVVRLLDMPLVQGARCLALELVQGTNLFQVMRRARLANELIPTELVVYIGLNVLSGLAYAHATEVDGVSINLVHRDVKPGNVLLSTGGEVKLTDFGISKSSLSVATTSRGVVKGTPHYLSPEQIKGEGATPRSDLFSLAVVMVEAITGTALFKRDTLAATLLSVSTGEREEIAVLMPRRHRALARVLERALAPDPSRRFESAGAMASALAGACPIDDTQAKKELARRVRAICDHADRKSLGRSPPPRLESTGAIPLEPALFDEDDPTDESPEPIPASQPARTARPDKITEPIRPPPLEVTQIEPSSPEFQKWTFVLGVLVGLLAMAGVQVALRLVSLPAP